MSSKEPSSIPLFDPLQANAVSKIEAERAVIEVLHSGVYLNGPEGESFEQEWALANGLPYCVGTGSGTSALMLALLALARLHPGRNEIVTVANSAPATVQAVWLAGLKPVLVDVDRRTGLMDSEAARRALTPYTLAILPVHLWGNRFKPESLDTEIVGECGVPALLEDCAHAHGLPPVIQVKNFTVRVRAWSFYPTKILAACGDAGAVTTDSKTLAEAIRFMTRHDLADNGMPRSACGNARLGELQASILRARLPFIKDQVEDRRCAVAGYLGVLPTEVETLTDPTGQAHLMVIWARERDKLRTKLREARISTGVHYPKPVFEWPVSRQLPCRLSGEREATAELCSGVLSLPLWPGMDEKIVERVGKAVKENMKLVASSGKR